MKQKESTRLSDYQRIVSYLYEYHHGIKGSNVGFAKIEKRQRGMPDPWIHITVHQNLDR